jgi:hypothetical protein
MLRNNADSNISIVLVRNKSDMLDLREVNIATDEDCAKTNDFMFNETWAANGTNVNETFAALIKSILELK